MAQQVIPADQLISTKYFSIGRCNNSVVLQISKVPDTKDTIKFKLDKQEIVYTVDMFRFTLNMLVETLENPFIAPVTIQVIESFMLTVGYQGVVDKTKINILQTFYVVVNHVHVDYVALLWWDFLYCVQQKKNVILYPRFTKFIIAKLIKKEMGDNAEATQLSLTLHKTSLAAEAKENVAEVHEKLEEEGIKKWLKIEPKSHKETLKVVVDDDMNKKEEKKDDKKDENETKNDDVKQTDDAKKKDNDDHIDHTLVETQVTNSLDNRAEKMQTPIPTPPRSSRINLSSDKEIFQELTKTVSPSTTTISKDPQPKRRISSKKRVTTSEFWKSHNKVDKVIHDIIPKIAERATNDLIEGNLKRMIADTIIQERDAFLAEVPALISNEFAVHAPKIIKEIFNIHMRTNVIQVYPIASSLTATTSSADLQQQWDDAFHSYHHNDHQDDDAPHEGEKSRVIWERVHDFQLGIESYQIKVKITTPTLTIPGIKTRNPYTIKDEPDKGLIYLNSKEENRVMCLVEIAKFCDATLKRVLKEVKLRIF
uniref:Uncharacterized protein n=1 Tax=Tanacetum cinerariifolium TaxID=118510 RepID=A0A699GZH7_TANCI|nr:hypothetical protein [Tanacetum cinerariifolium]